VPQSKNAVLCCAASSPLEPKSYAPARPVLLLARDPEPYTSVRGSTMHGCIGRASFAPEKRGTLDFRDVDRGR
jgi:hypothetical protein